MLPRPLLTQARGVCARFRQRTILRSQHFGAETKMIWCYGRHAECIAMGRGTMHGGNGGIAPILNSHVLCMAYFGEGVHCASCYTDIGPTVFCIASIILLLQALCGG